METSQIIAYVIALGIAVAIPGPGLTALMARTLSNGVTIGFAFMFGLMLGDLVYLTFAVFGLALVAANFANVFIVIKWFSVLYLCYLAWQFWTAKHQNMNTNAQTTRRDLLSAVVSGLGVTLGNPKPIAFYLALLPLVIDIESVTFSHWLTTLVPLTVIVLMSIGGVYILAANSMRLYLANRTAQKSIHRVAALAMVGAAGTMVMK